VATKNAESSTAPTDRELLEAGVRGELTELKNVAAQVRPDELKDGTWFTGFLKYALKTYAETVDAAWIKAKYPGLPPDAIVERRIQLAARAAAIEGGLTASAYSAAIVATIGSAGSASPLTLPAGALSFVTDLLYTSRLQLRLAWDLAVLYEHPVDLDDPEDLLDLVQVAFGIKLSEGLSTAVARLGPEAARQGVRAVAKGSTLKAIQALPIVGKHLLQRNIVKFAIPIVTVPLSMGVNHWSTTKIASVARRIYRDKARIAERSADTTAAMEGDFELLLRTVYVVLRADGKVAPEESWLLNALSAAVASHEGGMTAVERFTSRLEVSVDEVLADLSRTSDANKRLCFRAALEAAAADRKAKSAEVKVLSRIADVCGVSFRKEDLKREIARMDP
jgi:uncharacterized tellurite resistance protein B-like protein